MCLNNVRYCELIRLLTEIFLSCHSIYVTNLCTIKRYKSIVLWIKLISFFSILVNNYMQNKELIFIL